MASSSMSAALDNERAALREQGGVTEGSVAVGVTPSTPSKPADARVERLLSRDPDAFPAITGREEDWRFTPLARMRGLHDGTAAVTGVLPVTVTAPAGVTVEPVGPDHPLVGSALTPADKPAALAMRDFKEGQLVTITGEVPEPVVLRFEGTGEVSYGHVVVDVAPFASAVVVLEHRGDATHAGGVELRVGDGASLTLVSLQEWDDTAVHLSAQAALLGRDARLRSVVVTLGGDLVRLNPTVRYAAPGGEAELLGLAFADAGQHLEHRLLVDHAVPQCRSRVTYKSAVQGTEAHTVWIGDVLIRAQATGTDTYELNRNLLLTPEARADSVPNLEIETGEIAGAGHASATGRFDDEQLFYLQSRGIAPDEARRIVVLGFFTEILQQIGVPALEERLVEAIEKELGR
ncbi:MAG: Fe-S cluster assembly protein SufD [Mycobacteriales bacterium]